jgi:hypothetical protein
MVAHTAGGRHGPNYWASAQILFADIPRANHISVGQEAAPRTAEPAAPWFVPSRAGRAGPRRIALVLEHDLHAPALGFVRDQMADQATGHLVQLLVRPVPVIHVVANIPDVAYSDGLDASLMERRDKHGGLFVRNIFDLVVYTTQLPLC